MATFARLTKRDFTQKLNITSPATYSPILDLQVPRSQVWLLGHNDPFELTVVTQDAITPDATGAYTFQATEDMMDIPHLPDSKVVAVWDIDESKYLTIESVDYELNQIVVSDATDGSDCIIFYPFKKGSAQIVIQAPVGMGSLSLPLFSRSLSGVHAVDQFLTTSPLKLRENIYYGGSFGGWIIPETFRIQVLLKSAIAVTQHAKARNYHINLAYKHAPNGAFPANIGDSIKSLMTNSGR